MRSLFKPQVTMAPVTLVMAPSSAEEPAGNSIIITSNITTSSSTPSSSSTPFRRKRVEFSRNYSSSSSSSSSESEESEESEESKIADSDSDDEVDLGAFRPKTNIPLPIPEAPPFPPADWSAGRLPPSPPPVPTCSSQQGKAKNNHVGIEAAKQTPTPATPRKSKPDWTCNICYGEFKGTVGRPKCAQGHEFCKGCMGNYLRHCALENKKFKCPMHYACGLELPHALAQKYLPPSTFSSYVVNSAMEKVKEGDWVFRCAKIECPGVLRIPEGKAPFSATCPCCANYKVLTEKERKIFEEVYSQPTLSLEEKIDTVFLRISTKPCPHCHKTIEKDDGCPHMSCVCGNSFCWNCGKKYNSKLTFLLGRHNSKYGYKGCPELLFPNNRKACKITRGLLLTGKTAAMVTLGPPVAVVGLVVVGIPYGVFMGVRKGYKTLSSR